MKFGRNFCEVNMHQTELDFRFGIILLKCGGHDVISRRKVLSSVECIHSACPVFAASTR